ncbi:MAG: hypothetical protein EBR82_38345 [Caulobacteraceae bacterium]|nr:hypothetical protein [Caulobacteraceae bacterium]
MSLELSPKQLHELLFRGCTCTLDAAHSHFIRRTAGNHLAYAIVVTPDTADSLSSILTSELFHIQTINEDNLHYCVIWDRTEWEHSAERRRLVRENFLATDIAHLTRRAEEIQFSQLYQAIMATKVFPADKSLALTKSLTSQGEDHYRQRAKHLHDMLLGVFIEQQIYFPIDIIIKSIDTRNLLTSNESTAEVQTPPQH